MTPTYPGTAQTLSAGVLADGTTVNHLTEHGRTLELCENIMHFGAYGDGSHNDTAAFQAAIDTQTGLVVLPPGKNFRINTGLTWAHTQGELTILAHGATVTYYGSGTALTATMTSGTSGLPSIRIFGGTWVDGGGTAAGFVKLSDVRQSYFDKLIVKNFTVGTAFTLSNDTKWCEKNTFNDIQVRDCNKAFQFQVTGGTGSFARTTVSNLRLTGGVAGVCLIDMTNACNVYDSYFAPIHGNITSDAIVMKLDGGMGGTAIGPISVEQTNGVTDAYIFSVGTLGTIPTVRGPIKLRSTQLYLGGAPATGPRWIPHVDSAVAATTPGAVISKLQVYDETGVSLGYIPVYNHIT